MGRQPFRQMKTDGTMEEAGSASGGSSATDERPTKSIGRLTTNSWHNEFVTQSNTSWSSSFTLNYVALTDANHILLIPMLVPRTGTIDGMKINVRTASSIIGDTLEMSLYPSGDNNLPDGNKIIGSDSINITSTGMKTLTGANYSATAGEVLWGAFSNANPNDSNGAKYFISTAPYGSHGTGVKLPQNSTYNANDPTKYRYTGSGSHPSSFSESDFNSQSPDLNYRALQWWITYSG